jgi:ribosomal protein L34
VLAAIGLQMQAMGILKPIQEQVHIKQKHLKYSPVEKLNDVLITILGGAQGISEINTHLRSDPALQRAFGRTGCAEQSVVQETLDACTPTNNESERALRPSVIHRKVTHGFRSEWGAKAYAALQSVIATAKLKGRRFLISSLV